MSEETLKLEDLAPDRMKVELPSGATVGMLDPRELSFYDRADLGRDVKRLGDLQVKMAESPSTEDATELEVLLRGFARKVLPDASPDVIASMAPLHLDQVTGAFLGRYGGMIQQIAGMMEPKKPTGISAD